MKALCLPIIFFMMLASSCINRGTANYENSDSRPLFFILHSTRSRWEPEKDNNMRGTLTLLDVDHTVVFFTNNDAQTASSMEMQKFIKIWESGTEDNDGHPIQAGFVHYRLETKDSYDAEILLSDPIYDVENETLSFKGELIGTPLDEKEMGNTNIYIDDSSRYVYSNED
jgi:hypothetical protein